jgi:hypothetical protein
VQRGCENTTRLAVVTIRGHHSTAREAARRTALFGTNVAFSIKRAAPGIASNSTIRSITLR